MTRQETLSTPYSEMKDLMSCLAIYEGIAKPKKEAMNYDDAISLR